MEELWPGSYWHSKAKELEAENARLTAAITQCRDCLRDDRPPNEVEADSPASWVMWRLDEALAHKRTSDA